MASPLHFYEVNLTEDDVPGAKLDIRHSLAYIAVKRLRGGSSAEALPVVEEGDSRI
jgi:hypothetical protein